MFPKLENMFYLRSWSHSKNTWLERMRLRQQFWPQPPAQSHCSSFKMVALDQIPIFYHHCEKNNLIRIFVAQNKPNSIYWYNKNELALEFTTDSNLACEIHPFLKLWIKFVGACPPTQTPTQKSKNGFSMSNSHKTASRLVSFWMIIEALRFKIHIFLFHSMGLKFQKITEYNGLISTYN